MTDPTTYDTAGGAPSPGRVLTPEPGAGRRPDTPPTLPPSRTLSAALVAALGEMSDAPENHQGNYGKYADLSDVLGVIRPVLAKHDLGVVQDVSVDDDRVRVMTMLVHGSTGEKMLFGPVAVTVTSTTPQAIGGAVTYARRYGLAAACGVAPGPADDDDGEESSKPKAGVSPPVTRPQGGRERAAPGRGAAPSPSGAAPTGPQPWVNDPPDPIHAEQVDVWSQRISALQRVDPTLWASLRRTIKSAGWTTRVALTGTIANAVLDALELRVDEVEAAELAAEQQLLNLDDEEST